MILLFIFGSIPISSKERLCTKFKINFYFLTIWRCKPSMYHTQICQPIWSIKSDHVNLVAPACPVHRARYSTNWTGKVDPARKFKCNTAARDQSYSWYNFVNDYIIRLRWNLKNLSGGLNLSRGLNMVGST